MKSKLWILLLLLAFILICESHNWHGHKSKKHGKHSGGKSGHHAHKGSHSRHFKWNHQAAQRSYDKDHDSQKKGLLHYKHQVLNSVLKHIPSVKDRQTMDHRDIQSHDSKKFHGHFFHGMKKSHGHSKAHDSKKSHGHFFHGLKKSHGHSKAHDSKKSHGHFFHGLKKSHGHSKAHGSKKSHGHFFHGLRKSHGHSKAHGSKKSHGHFFHGWKKSHGHSKAHGSRKGHHHHLIFHGGKRSHGHFHGHFKFHGHSHGHGRNSRPKDIEEATSGELERPEDISHENPESIVAGGTTENYEEYVSTTDTTPVIEVTEPNEVLKPTSVRVPNEISEPIIADETSSPNIFSEPLVENVPATAPVENKVTEPVVDETTTHGADQYTTKNMAKETTPPAAFSEHATVKEPSTTSLVDQSTTDTTIVDKITEQFSEKEPTMSPVENKVTESVVDITTNPDVDKSTPEEPVDETTQPPVFTEQPRVETPISNAPVDDKITNPIIISETTEYFHNEVSTNKAVGATPSDFTKNPEEIQSTTDAADNRFPCMKDGAMYAVGTFADPNDGCGTCTCHDSGSIACEKRKCPKLKCGQMHHVYESVDSCCPVCSSECTKAVRKACPKLECKRSQRFYPVDSCCKQCGCKKKGSYIPEGGVLTEDPCDRCACANGKISCQPTECPSGGLQCVDVQRDENCTYHCPNGKTCYAKGVAIPFGGFTKVGKKVCTCIEGYFPNAFCASIKVKRKVRKMQKKMCVSESQITDTLQLLSSSGGD